jgi:hypothetical protein
MCMPMPSPYIPACTLPATLPPSLAPQVNPRFTEEALPLVDAEKGAILYCAVGGSMEGATDANNKVKALQSRWGGRTTGS